MQSIANFVSVCGLQDGIRPSSPCMTHRYVWMYITNVKHAWYSYQVVVHIGLSMSIVSPSLCTNLFSVSMIPHKYGLFDMYYLSHFFADSSRHAVCYSFPLVTITGIVCISVVTVLIAETFLTLLFTCNMVEHSWKLSIIVNKFMWLVIGTCSQDCYHSLVFLQPTSSVCNRICCLGNWIYTYILG